MQICSPAEAEHHSRECGRRGRLAGRHCEDDVMRNSQRSDASHSQRSERSMERSPSTPRSLNDEDEKRVKHLMKQCKASGTKIENLPINKNDVVWMLDRVVRIFKSQPMLVEAAAPISICGDIHGQFTDLLRLFNQNGWPPKTRYLFLGDYVDRGPKNLETISLMFCLKLRYPTDFYLLRGNHETRSINRVYGFYDEVRVRFDAALFDQFNDVFSFMPLAGLVSGRILCMHGGISPELSQVSQINEIKRPLEDVPDVGLVADLLWADPDKKVQGFAPSSRGISYLFGADVLTEFCDTLQLDLVARAHQVVNEGYEFFADERLITLFSAPDYCDQFTNAGGILSVEPDLNCKIKQLPSKTKLAPKSKRK